MSRRAKQQQLSVARLRSKGLTLAQANSFAAKQRKSGQPVIVLMALAGICLMGAGGYATLYGGFGAEAAAAAVEIPQDGKTLAAETVRAVITPAPEPAVVVQASEDSAQTPTQVLLFNTSKTEAPPVDWEQASYIAFDATEDEVEFAEPDCVDTLRSMTAETVLFFAPGSVQPIETNFDALLQIDEVARTCAGAKVVVAGHSDASGSPALNLELSWQRADATIDLLRAIDIDTSRFESIGYGARLPLAQGSAGDDAINRRVEFDVRRVEGE
ncbi:MAG: OmpA family protein [Pseudomonadota bacterium]